MNREQLNALLRRPANDPRETPRKPQWRDISARMLRDLRTDIASGLGREALLDRIDDMFFRLTEVVKKP